MNSPKRNVDLLRDAAENKSTAFTPEERELYGLRGLLPYISTGQDIQIVRIMNNLRRKEYDIERYIFLSALQDRNERLFFQTTIEHIEEIMPLIYTPTVGQACKEFSHIYRHAKGFFITPDDQGDIHKILANWPDTDIRVIVVTDGERILGLGDLGANGMGIPIGKLNLYIATAGIHPHQCLPVMLDMGTNNEQLLNDPLYIGYPHPRLTGDRYFAIIDEFVRAVQQRYPKALIQFEDFITPNAYALLHKYENEILCFNDDIQGTAAVTLAGVYSSTKITGIPFHDLNILFMGAGSAATGIADLMVRAFIEEGLSEADAYRRLWFIDNTGLVVRSRTDLAEHKIPYAHEHPFMDVIEAIDTLKPHILIGATTKGGSFTKEIIEHMAANHPRPVIFALSNPTEKAECTPEQAYLWSHGQAVYASGSPFKPLEFGGRNFKPGQANNVYIFPGLGLGALFAEASRINNESFLTAAKALADCLTDEDVAQGALFPPLTRVREIALHIATAVAEQIYDAGLARRDRPANLRDAIAKTMYDPRY
jgi:malate dehydrogenase (oxaloacetate-decarboxylating)(NADP+)